nr:immunoglobulin heavy chain junction region [Mus musculus]
CVREGYYGSSYYW